MSGLAPRFKCFHVLAIITLVILKYAEILTTVPGEGDDDKFSQPATACQLQRNGQQVLFLLTEKQMEKLKLESFVDQRVRG